MANTIKIPRAHLVMALCLPLATLLGYFMAEPMDSSSLAVVVLVLAVLAVPLMMQWYHPLLVLSWNLWIMPYFLPGKPLVWMMMAPVALLFALLNRSVSRNHRFIPCPSVTKSLLFLAGVVLVTGQLTGGIGFNSLGSDRYGGKYYFYILAAVAGYFAFTSQRIPPERAGLYLAMFFLPGLTSLISNLAYAAGPGFYFIYNLFPASFAQEQASEGALNSFTIVRIGGLQSASLALSSYLLARYGIRGVLDRTKPLPAFLFLASCVGWVACGFRSSLIFFALIFLVLFYIEGLHRTRLLTVFAALAIAGAAVLLPFANRLPLAMQRSLAFLPINIDPMVKEITKNSTDWRVEIWKVMIPQIPKYFWKGKGYLVHPQDLEMASNQGFRAADGSAYGAILSGDYHSGPLSVIIPFGIFGVIGVVWFLAGALRVLYQNYRFGDPSLKRINACLLALFWARLLIFLFVFGSFYGDMYIFTGLIGFSVSLNGQPKPQVEEVPIEESLQAFETLS